MIFGGHQKYGRGLRRKKKKYSFMPGGGVIVAKRLGGGGGCSIAVTGEGDLEKRRGKERMRSSTSLEAQHPCVKEEWIVYFWGVWKGEKLGKGGCALFRMKGGNHIAQLPSMGGMKEGKDENKEGKERAHVFSKKEASNESGGGVISFFEGIARGNKDEWYRRKEGGQPS